MNRTRRAGLALVAAVLLIGAVGSGAWFWAEGLVERQWAAQLGALRAEGFLVATGEPKRAGWPIALGLDIPDVRIELPSGELPGGASWRTDRLLVRIEALHPDTLLLRPDGAQSLRLGTRPPVPYEADSLRAAVPLGGGTMVVRARSLRLGTTPAALLSSAELRLDGLALRFDAEELALPGSNLPAAGPLTLDAALTSPLPPPGTDPAQRLVAWRDAGGRVLLRKLALRWASLDAIGEGQGGVDARGQPSADGSLHVRGGAEAAATLAAAGYLSAGQATAMRAVLSLLSRPAPGGGASEANLPFTLRDGILTVARIPIARVTIPGWPEN